MSEVSTDFPHCLHRLRLYNSSGVDGTSVDIANVVDIRGESNYELTMRLVTDVENENHEFFTDLNGFQVSAFGCAPSAVERWWRVVDWRPCRVKSTCTCTSSFPAMYTIRDKCCCNEIRPVFFLRRLYEGSGTISCRFKAISTRCQALPTWRTNRIASVF